MIIALLLGQGAYITHKYDNGFYAHKSGDLAYKSLKAKPVNDAIVGADMLAVPVFVGRTKFYTRGFSVARVIDVVYHSRAPPFISPA